MKTSELIAKIKSDFHETGDLLIRQITINDVGCCFVYLDTLSDKLLLEQDVITPVCECEELFDGKKRTADELRELLLAVTGFGQDIVPLGYGEAVTKIAEGDVGFFLDGQDGFCMFSLRKFDKRAIAEPPTSTVLKGPREGFIEEIKTNTALIRRRIKSPDLVFENLTVGKYSSTPVSIAYVCSVSDPETVKQVRERLEQIDIDGIIDSAYVAGFLEERRHSLFKQIGNSEKPDVIAAKLLEGRIAVIVDGSPLVLTLPFVLLEDLQDGYDYYSGDWRATFARIFRLFGAALTVLLPAAYVALQSYHYHLLPIKFLVTLVSATSAIPFPPAVEMLFVLLLFEILNEASIRMPRYLGVSLSIVGAIVLGDTAVKAGLISSPAVLVVALSSIGVFCIPDQVGTLSILRIVFLLASAVLGLFGIMVLLVLLASYLSTLTGYGTPYLAPYAPRIFPDLKDGIMKAEISEMDSRPYSLPYTQNRTRLQKEHLNDE